MGVRASQREGQELDWHSAMNELANSTERSKFGCGPHPQNTLLPWRDRDWPAARDFLIGEVVLFWFSLHIALQCPKLSLQDVLPFLECHIPRVAILSRRIHAAPQERRPHHPEIADS